MPNNAAQLQDYEEAANKRDLAWEEHLQRTDEDFRLTLMRVCRSVHAGDDKKRHELIDSLEHVDLYWELAGIIPHILKKNAKIEELRDLLDKRIILPCILAEAEKTWEA